ncbi:hypothetical protein [Clostridium sp. B9]|uniref:hypothetical protein n=1 Tax=Clostridium sp. B9 TaxID=3423224 RepID=UPI003D2EB5B1
MRYLPLYSNQGGRHVQERSGLNHWNADGRPRNFNEVYIPIPKKIHTDLPEFFPERDTHFALILPNERILIAKLCQSNCKALMSCPNSDLGEWILREVLEIEPWVLANYDMLLSAGIDSVCVRRVDIDNEELMERLEEEMLEILRRREHNIFRIEGYRAPSDYEINAIFHSIINERLYYTIEPSGIGAYENQFI